jgi:hypothetical protein
MDRWRKSQTTAYVYRYVIPSPRSRNTRAREVDGNDRASGTKGRPFVLELNSGLSTATAAAL